MRIVVDSSVVTKAFAREQGSHAARALLAAATAGSCELLAPSIMIYEVSLAIVRKGFQRRIVSEKLDELVALTDAGTIELVHSDRDLMKDAASIAERISPSPRTKPWINDAVFHALARSEAATLVTADRAYVERLKSLPRLQAGVVLFDKLSLPMAP